jgi:hypothetical protein
MTHLDFYPYYTDWSLYKWHAKERGRKRVCQDEGHNSLIFNTEILSPTRSGRPGPAMQSYSPSKEM